MPLKATLPTLIIEDVVLTTLNVTLDVTFVAGVALLPSWNNLEHPNVFESGVHKGILLTVQTSPTIAAGLSSQEKVVPSDIKIWSAVPIANSCFKLLALPCHKLHMSMLQQYHR